jgi:hypothetical protein
MVGDDGEGKAYKIEIFPDVKRWYQEPRRLCGKGKLDWRPLAGPAVENTSGPDIIRIEKSVKTTAEQDKNLAANARALDGVAITYCLGLQDCRAVEKCTVAGRTLSQRIVDYLQKFVPPSWTPAPICPLP